MSSTRRAKEGSPLRQERYMSSPEFERGLKALPVAKRCEVLRDPRDRELIWWLQSKSQQEDGLADVTAELIRRNPHAPATASMRRFGLNPSHRYNADQVRAVRKEIGRDPQERIFRSLGRLDFPLRGECEDWDGYCSEEAHREKVREAAKFPESYLAADFLKHCATVATRNLANDLQELCLNPSVKLSDTAPWYFTGLRSALAALMKSEAEEHCARLVVTEIGRRVHGCLDRALKSRRIVVVNGVPRIGKTFAAQSWVQQNAGRARLVEVPTGNDDISFFRAIARGIGLGNFINYKATEIRERVEAVLFTGQLLLVLDEGKRLWPQRNLRYGYPSRIEWVMSLINHGAHICIITTPEFFAWQQRLEQTSCWASGQFTGRISRHEMLPKELSRADLEAVARSVLPEAGDVDISAVAAYASSSARYLAAIDDIAADARYIAESEGRDTVRRADIQRAMREGVIPSDRSLAAAIQATAPKRAKASLMPAQPPIMPPLNEPEGADEPAQTSARGVGAREGVELSTVRHGRAVRPAGDLVGA